MGAMYNVVTCTVPNSGNGTGDVDARR